MYFGSTRFFKHIILAALSLLVIVPVVLCVVLGVQNHRYQAALGVPTESGFPAAGWNAQAAELDGAGPSAPPETPSPGPLPAEEPAWQALFPELYADDTGRSTVNEEKTVYLTFDDGPSTRTPEVLEILERYGVKATFFVLGREDAQSQAWMRAIVEGGHTLGMHSYTHDYREIYASVEDFLADYEALFTLIQDATGTTPQVFRFPGGSINSYNAPIYQELIGEMTRRGFAYFDWNVSTADAAVGGATAAQIEENALKGLETRRAFVLMHDSAGKGATVEALPAIIEAYRAAGFTFAPLTVEVTPVAFGYTE